MMEKMKKTKQNVHSVGICTLVWCIQFLPIVSLLAVAAVALLFLFLVFFSRPDSCSSFNNASNMFTFTHSRWAHDASGKSTEFGRRSRSYRLVCMPPQCRAIHSSRSTRSRLRAVHLPHIRRGLVRYTLILNIFGIIMISLNNASIQRVLWARKRKFISPLFPKWPSVLRTPSMHTPNAHTDIKLNFHSFWLGCRLRCAVAACLLHNIKWLIG